LTAGSTRTHNVQVRVRLTVIVVALAVLAFVGLRQGDLRSAAPQTSARTSGMLDAHAAPHAIPPAVVSTAVVGSATGQALPFLQWRRHARPAQGATGASRLAPAGANGADRPHSYPLLI
jgi:hypothetical protein